MKRLSAIIIFHNGIREAQRSLYSLSAKYQIGVLETDYEVIVVDSNSTNKLSQNFVNKFGSNYKYFDVSTNYPSPSKALNFGLSIANSQFTLIMIDGAHVITPKIISMSIEILTLKSNSFTYVKAYHIGKFSQNFSLENGYNQKEEDLLFKQSNWPNFPYNLFKISNFEQTKSILYKTIESNCFCVQKTYLTQINALNERFQTKGGGFLNLHIFKQLIHEKNCQPICLVGEGSFHQFHDGVTTNVPINNRPLIEMENEYLEIVGEKYTPPSYIPFLYGKDEEDLIKSQVSYKHIIEIVNFMLSNNKFSLALNIIDFYIDYKFPFNEDLKLNKSNILIRVGKLAEAESLIKNELITKPNSDKWLIQLNEINKISKRGLNNLPNNSNS